MPATTTPRTQDFEEERKENSSCQSTSDLYAQARRAYNEVRENQPGRWEELKSFTKDMEGTLDDGDI